MTENLCTFPVFARSPHLNPHDYFRNLIISLVTYAQNYEQIDYIYLK